MQIRMNTYSGPVDKRPMVDAAIELLEQVVNSSDFRQRVETRRRYRHHEGLSSAQIYNRLMTGDRSGRGALDRPRTVTFNYAFIEGGSDTTLGYRQTGTNNIFTYHRHLAWMDVHDLVSHLAHEIVGHLAGNFGHPRLNVRGRGRSVPYVIDFIVDTLLEQMPSASVRSEALGVMPDHSDSDEELGCQ